MSVELTEEGIFINLDLRGVQESLEAKEQLKEQTPSEPKEEQRTEPAQEKAPKLVDRIPEKGMLLNIVA